jgi:hypothetical protein
MRYLLSIYVDESGFATATPEEREQMSSAYADFTDEIDKAGVLRGGDGLQPSPTATTVRMRDGELLLTDGPFAETREALGGFYLVEVEDLDAAIEWAAKIPGASTGCVEVRPLMDYEAFAARVAAANAGASA